jgi:hypothetical protein
LGLFADLLTQLDMRIFTTGFTASFNELIFAFGTDTC